MKANLPAERSAQTKDGTKTILVLVDGGPTDEAVLEMSCLLANQWGASVHLLRPILVERSLPLDAVLPAAAQHARAVLERSRRTASRFGCSVEVTEVRTRDIAAAVVDEAADLGCDLVVLGSGADEGRSGSPTVTSLVLQQAPCPVWVYRAALGKREPSLLLE